MGTKTFSDVCGRRASIGHALYGELSSISPRITWKIGLEGMLYASTGGIRRFSATGDLNVKAFVHPLARMTVCLYTILIARPSLPPQRSSPPPGSKIRRLYCPTESCTRHCRWAKGEKQETHISHDPRFGRYEQEKQCPLFLSITGLR